MRNGIKCLLHEQMELHQAGTVESGGAPGLFESIVLLGEAVDDVEAQLRRLIGILRTVWEARRGMERR